MRWNADGMGCNAERTSGVVIDLMFREQEEERKIGFFFSFFFCGFGCV